MQAEQLNAYTAFPTPRYTHHQLEKDGKPMPLHCSPSLSIINDVLKSMMQKRSGVVEVTVTQNDK